MKFLPNIFMALLALTWAAADISAASEDDWFKYLGDNKPYNAPAKNISSAEAMPPLPLPATPLRRTERKKPPQPDYLLGKVIWGQSATFQDANGQQLEVADWNLCPTDLDRLMDKTRKLGLNYHWRNINLTSFDFSPATVPALLFSGTRTIRLGDSQVEQLRSYVSSGGMIIFDSIAGSPYFYASAYALTEKLFPECQLLNIPGDHPIYHIITEINDVKVPLHENIKNPELEGIYIGSRIGVLLSRHGLGCGWNDNTDPLMQLPGSSYFENRSANELGMNIVAYVAGYAQAGFIEGQPEMFSLADQQTPTDELLFAQIKHNGSWNVHPNAATALLMKIKKYTSIKVNLQRRAISLEKDQLNLYPFVFISGLSDLRFSDKEIAILSNYLQGQGFILINNGLGLKEFDQAVKREFARIIPGVTFKKLEPNHQIYNSLYSIKEVKYTPRARNLGTEPCLMGIYVSGKLKVVYSPVDLEAGWLDIHYPLIFGYERSSATQLGMNIISYIMTN
ncbi:MAG: DUF4159 domain-containing protein [Sedimentisphaerales bacterium]|nr:DUF4159 domain-containing protein [Sedimentisphaerales bacterium]